MADENKVVITYATIDELVQKVDPDDKQIAYQFSNGREFEDSGDNNGIYTKD